MTTRLRRLLAGGMAFALVLGAALSIHSIVNRAIPTMVSGSSLPTIVLDPGHGGADGGAVGVDGIIEKDINLSIAMLLRDLFELNGFTVVMTRETDLSIHDEGVQGLRRQKTSDLHNRLAIMDQYPDCIFISIHQNKFGDSSQAGTQVFYGPNHPNSPTLAAIVQQNVVEWLQAGNKRKQKQGDKDLYLIYEADCPAILIECGFLSNPAEARKLVTPDYQAQMAFTVFYSVVEYCELCSPDGSPVTTARAG